MTDEFADLTQDEHGDLAATPQGDLSIAAGEGNLVADLKRRFETRLGALFYDQTYGNPMLNRLSQPLGPNAESDLAADGRECIMADPRVLNGSVSVRLNREQRLVSCEVRYQTSGSSGGFSSEVKLVV